VGLLNKGFSPHWRRNHWQHSWPGRETSGFRACISCKWCSTSTTHGKLHLLSCASEVRGLLYGRTLVRGFTSTRLSMRGEL
jgi:hypothetical protein